MSSPPDLLFVTVATHFTPNLTNLLKLCLRYGEKLVVLGLGDSRPRAKGWNTWYKLLFFAEFLRDNHPEEKIRVQRDKQMKISIPPCTLGPETLIVFIDSSDAILNLGSVSQWLSGDPGNRDKFLETYRALNTDIVFGGMFLSHPCDKAFGQFPPDEYNATRFVGLCSSMMMGSVRAFWYYYSRYLLTLLDKSPEKKVCQQDDEKWWAFRYYAQRDPRWNQHPEEGKEECQVVGHFMKQQYYDNPLRKKLKYPEWTSGKARETDAPSICVDSKGALFHNLAEDQMNLLYDWKWDEHLERWGTKPFTSNLVTRYIERRLQKAYGRPPRKYHPEKPTSSGEGNKYKKQRRTFPFVLHVQGRPKVALSLFSRKIMSVENLNSDAGSLYQSVVLILGISSIVLLAILGLLYLMRSRSLSIFLPDLF